MLTKLNYETPEIEVSNFEITNNIMDDGNDGDIIIWGDQGPSGEDEGSDEELPF